MEKGKWMCLSLSCVQLCDPNDCSPPGSSLHEILQARMQEWVAISFSRASSWPKDWTCVSRIASRFLTYWATKETDKYFLFTLPSEWFWDAFGLHKIKLLVIHVIASSVYIPLLPFSSPFSLFLTFNAVPWNHIPQTLQLSLVIHCGLVQGLLRITRSMNNKSFILNEVLFAYNLLISSPIL